MSAKQHDGHRAQEETGQVNVLQHLEERALKRSRGDQMGRAQIFWNESGELGAIKQNTLKVRGNEQTEENRGYKLWKQSETELLFLCDVYVLSLFANCYYLGQHLLVLDDVLIGGK